MRTATALVAIFVGAAFASPAAGDQTQAVLDSIMAETAAYSTKTLDRLTADQRKDLDAGEIVIVSGPIKDSQGRTLPEGKRADTFVVLDLPPSVVFSILTDLNRYKDIFKDVSDSRVLATQKVGGETQQWYFQAVDLPAITDPLSYMLIHSKTIDANGDGVADAWAIWWHRDDTHTTKNAGGEIIQPNLTINSGAWKILPWDGGEKALVFYTLIQVPGFSVPDFLWEKATSLLGIPKVIEEVGKAAKTGRYAR